VIKIQNSRAICRNSVIAERSSIYVKGILDNKKTVVGNFRVVSSIYYRTNHVRATKDKLQDNT